MSMYRSYLLKNNFWAKKGCEKNTYIRHDINAGGIYATISDSPKGVNIMLEGETYFFNNFDKLDEFFANLRFSHTDFERILKRKFVSRKLRTLEI